MAIPNCKNVDNSWSVSTNWTISGGSPFTTVNCVSSSDESPNTTGRRTPLILKAFSDNFGPCDIKLSFMQRHKIKKIYVRSTARTYEVHYTPALESNDVYLCTVECDMAFREEDVLYTSDNKENREAISETSKVSNEETASESDNDSTKDEWVVLGIPASSPDQDFYEVATEINDADPCISVTLRLLSPHSKVLIHIDEVRVFADALELSDSENKRSQGENSAESTLMTTLAPKISQLSMFSVGCLQDEHFPSVVNEQETGSGTAGLTETASGVEPDGNCETPDEPSQSQKRAQNSDKEEKHDFPCGKVEKVLEQLLLRVCKIEDLFSIFEKNALKPIINMEARLQRVEQYMELLAKNSKCPAPSITESKSSAILDSERVYPSCSAYEFQNGNPASSKTYKPADDKSSPIIGSRFVPRLVVTAPAFSCDEDENEKDICLSEPPKVFTQWHEKQTMSVADVLDPFSSFNIQSSESPDSPLMFFPPSLLGRGPVPVTSKIDGEEFGQPAERQQVLESLLGGFGQARQLGTGLPKSAATPTKIFGLGFLGYESNGFSKTAAQGGSFASQASAVKSYFGAASSAGELLTFPTAGANGGGLTAASGNEFTRAATSCGAPSAASGGPFAPATTSSDVPVAAFGSSGFTARAPNFGVPTSSASGGGFTAPATSFGAPSAASGGPFAPAFDVPTSASGGGFTASGTSFGAPSDVSGGGFASAFGAPTSASGSGFTARATSFGAPSDVSGGGFSSAFGAPTSAFSSGFTARSTNFYAPSDISGGGFASAFGAPVSASGSGFTARSTNFGAPSDVSGGGFASAFGAPTSASGSGFTARFGAPSDVSGGGFASAFGAPTSASGSRFTSRATSFGAPSDVSGGGFASAFGAPTSSSGSGFTARATSFDVPATASRGGFTAAEINHGVPAAASGGGFTAPATSFDVPTTAFGGGFSCCCHGF